MQTNLSRYLTAFYLTILWSTSLFAAELDELEYITEIYPPFNYVEGGVLRGEAVDLLISATALAGHPIVAKNIQVQPCG